MFKVYTILVLLILLGSCERPQEKSKQSIHKETEEPVVDEIEAFIEESRNYLENRDFDGDNLSDFLYFDYSGGAHCCYTMSLKLSTLEDTLHYPFEMDGGYGFGIVDGSQYDQFHVEDYDNDGLPEIFMMISSYNGEKYPVLKEWTQEYGFSTNYILFDFKNNAVSITDYDSLIHIKQ